MSEYNYYKILGASVGIAQKEITRAYSRRAKQLHPDLQPPERKQWAGEQMQRLNQAYAVLGDPVERARYDALAGLRPPTAQAWSGSQPQDDWWDNLAFNTYPRARSRRWQRLMLTLDFVFWMLVAYFILIGAYLIFFEWNLLVEWGYFLDPAVLMDPQRKAGVEAQQIRSHWIFATIWYIVFILAIIRAIPRRR